MIEVTQTEVESGKGNCLSACLASLLEMSLKNVPYFVETDSWYGEVQQWLQEQGLQMVLVSVDGISRVGNIHHIIMGVGPRSGRHSVIGFNRKIVFDPHPSRDGLVSIDSYAFLVPEKYG